VRLAEIALQVQEDEGGVCNEPKRQHDLKDISNSDGSFLTG